MKELYAWIQNLTGYVLFMSVLEHLLPGRQYARYLRLFSGMVLILLVFQPFTAGLRLEERIARYYESFVFRYEADDLKKEILGVEQKQFETLIAQYERAVEQDVLLMAEDAGLQAESCRVEIGRTQGKETFGSVTSIQVTVGGGTDEEGAGDGRAESGQPENRQLGEGQMDRGRTESRQAESVQQNSREVSAAAGAAARENFASGRERSAAGQAASSIRPVESVNINISSGAQAETGKVPNADHPQDDISSADAALWAKVGALRQSIASYYKLEESYVEVQVMEGER